MSLEERAKFELEKAGFFSKDQLYGGMLGNAVMELMRVFAAQGHSGMSAAVTIRAFSRVAKFKPLTPLTGEDDEWNKVGDGEFQNRRCSHVFKNETGAYDSQGRVFREPNGTCWTRRESRVPITFPYTPTTEYVDVKGETDADPTNTNPQT